MKFSIIVPVYNLEHYVRDAIDSVLAQTFADFECICVDDGSTDGSGKILDDYAKKDSRIKVVHKVNGGEGSARNAGLDAAQGDWIALLDGDDVWTLDFLKTMCDAIDQNSRVEIVTARQTTFNDGEKIEALSGSDSLVAFFDITHKVPDVLLNIGVWNSVYRREFLGDLRFSELKIGADRVFTFQTLNRANGVVYVDKQIYCYRVRGDSMQHARMSFERRMDSFKHSVIVLGLMMLGRKYSLRWTLRYFRNTIRTLFALAGGR